jgi:hypothetical protein
LADCNGSADQQWTFANGAVTAYNGQFCLDVTDGVDNNGVKLQVWQCYSGSVNQKWYWTWDNQSVFRFFSLSFGLFHIQPSYLLYLTNLVVFRGPITGVASISPMVKWPTETKFKSGIVPTTTLTKSGTLVINSTLFPTRVKRDRPV